MNTDEHLAPLSGLVRRVSKGKIIAAHDQQIVPAPLERLQNGVFGRDVEPRAVLTLVR